MSAFPYEPLDPGEDSFRLLMLRKGLPDRPLEAELFDSFLSAPPEYSALSYTWELSEDERESMPEAVARQLRDETMSISGHDVQIKPNLAAALRRIRRPDRAVVLWVDALCIDQSNDRERGHQVQQMSKIYKTAEEVLVWLGEYDDRAHETEMLFELINSLDDYATRAQSAMDSQDWVALCRQGLPDTMQTPPAATALLRGSAPPPLGELPRVRVQTCLARLLGRRWFTRAWVLQEVAMARMARILCGEFSCPARTFALMPSLMGTTVGANRQAVLDIMPRYRQKTWWSSGRPLAVLLSKFAWAEASRTRDCIYALLGLSTDACDPRTLYPHYDIPEEQVMRNVASVLLFGTVLDDGHAFPRFALRDLRHSVSLLVLKTLLWVLEGEPGPGGDDRAALRRTGARLVRRINEHFRLPRQTDGGGGGGGAGLGAEAALIALAMFNKDGLAMLHLLHGADVVVDLVCGAGTDEGRDMLTVTSSAELCPDARALFDDRPGPDSEPEKQLWLASMIEGGWPTAPEVWPAQQQSSLEPVPSPVRYGHDLLPPHWTGTRSEIKTALYERKFRWKTAQTLQKDPQLACILARRPRYRPTESEPASAAAIDQHPQIASHLRRYPWLVDELDEHPWLAPMLEQHPWLAAELERYPQLLYDLQMQPLLASQLQELPAPGPRPSLRILSFTDFSRRKHGDIRGMARTLLSEDFKLKDWAARVMQEARTQAQAEEMAAVRQACKICRYVLNYRGDGLISDPGDSP